MVLAGSRCLSAVEGCKSARKTTAGYDIDIFATYFPPEVTRLQEPATVINWNLPNKGLSVNPASTKSYLLDRTRYTPRDFVSLLNCIKVFAPETTVSMGGIASGLRLYASTHFVPEIRDELDGYLLPDERENLMNAFGKNRNGLIRIEGLRKRIPERYHSRLPAMLSDLFNCGVLGNWEDPGSPTRRTYRYRFPECRLDLEGKMMLHPAFALAFNARPAEAEAFKEDLRKLAVGKIRKVAIPMFPGAIMSNDGWMFRYQTNDLVGNPGTRLCEGDTVGFEPPPYELLKGRRKSIMPFPPVHGVRVLSSDAVRLIADRNRGAIGQ